MTDFSDRVERIAISGIREVFEAAGGDAINLGLGQPDFPAPENAREAAITAIKSGKADGYTSNPGVRPLREAISEKHTRDNEINVPPENLIATAGGSEALHLAIEAHVNTDEEVIMPDPGFVSYAALTHLAGGVPNPVGLRDDLTMSPEAVEEAITDDTAAFVVCSPANPTGAVQIRGRHARVRSDRGRTRRALYLRRGLRAHRLRGGVITLPWSSPRPATSSSSTPVRRPTR